MLRIMLRWPWFILAFLVSGIFCLSSPGWCGLLHSQSSAGESTGLSRLDLEKELISSYLETLGWSRPEIQNKLSHLSNSEIHRLARTLEEITAGGEEKEGKKAAEVTLVIVILLAAITGFYLFYQSNK